MTPTLTNERKYSPDFGFSPGVVVEVTISDNYQIVAYFHSIDNESVLFLEPSKKGIRARYPKFDEIKSIRLLSGKWAIWQFAPSGSEIAILWEDGDINFFTQENFEKFEVGMLDEYGDELETEAPKYTAISRPWWWLEGQK